METIFLDVAYIQGTLYIFQGGKDPAVFFP